MSFALIYLAQRLVYRVRMFISNWYIGGFLVIGSTIISILESLDRTWAFRINLRNLFKPLYQDQSIIGRILGFLLRSSRLIIAGVLYAVIIIAGAAVYVFWASIPLYIVDKGFFSNTL